MHELISPDSAIDLLVTSQLGVCCKRTGVSHLVVKLHSMYKCRLGGDRSGFMNIVEVCGVNIGEEDVMLVKRLGKPGQTN